MNRLQREDGVTLAFHVHNPKAPGVPLLLTHGFGATAGMWDANVDALSVDRPVIVWDQRGHGSSDAPGDMNRYTQFQVAQSMPIAAGNEGGGLAGAGVGLGAGMLMAQQMMNAAKPSGPDAGPAAPAAPSAGPGPAAPGGGGAAGATKFCMNCGHQIPKPAKFCPECGGSQ